MFWKENDQNIKNAKAKNAKMENCQNIGNAQTQLIKMQYCQNATM